ncbi:hypothetical protein IJG78_03270 [Candidatus Saccharibacteria bacterium]|nr:hypothetical protein [Candidatus Saccharibacteria bacterium]
MENQISNNTYSTGSTKARRYPLSYIYSGYYYWGDGGYLGTQGTYGDFWSNLANSSTHAHSSYINSSTLTHGTSNKANGYALRYINFDNFTMSSSIDATERKSCSSISIIQWIKRSAFVYAQSIRFITATTPE